MSLLPHVGHFLFIFQHSNALNVWKMSWNCVAWENVANWFRIEGPHAYIVTKYLRSFNNLFWLSGVHCVTAKEMVWIENAEQTTNSDTSLQKHKIKFFWANRPVWRIDMLDHRVYQSLNFTVASKKTLQTAKTDLKSLDRRSWFQKNLLKSQIKSVDLIAVALWERNAFHGL